MVKYFSCFRFDDATTTLVRGGQPVPITRKAGELLRCLMDHAGSSVPHKTILSTVWPDTHVQPDNVKVLVRELRRALGDDARQPRFIRSIPARGYAFIASAAHAPGPLYDRQGPSSSPVMFVSRHEELRALTRAIELPRPPYRLVLIEGECGIGKTALCDEFIRTANRRPGVRVAYVPCVDQVASSDPYFPIATALRHLIRHFPDVLSALDLHAPGWLAILRRGARGHRDPGLEPEAMARELAAAFQDLSRRAATVLVLEDLQWTDAATIDLLHALAQRVEPVGFFVAATCSPHASTPAGPLLRRLTADMEGRPGFARFQLHRLTPAAVRRYLANRFEHAAIDRLARPLYATTQGHPSSLVAALDALMTAGHLHHAGAGWRLDLPSRLLEPVLSSAVLPALAKQFEQLEEDRTLLQAAAAIGIAFSADDVACAIDAGDPDPVRRRLDVLVERGFLLNADPNGHAGQEYGFPHASHAEALLMSAAPFEQLRVAERLAGGAMARELERRTFS